METNKRGQFYLLAAVIIVAIIIGFVAVSNYAKKKSFTKIYDLGEELGIESAKVLDYGTYSELDEANMTNLLTGFIEAYSEYGEIQKLYFIFGNSSKITIYGYHELMGGDIVVSINEIPSPNPLVIGGAKQVGTQEYSGTDIDKVTITIGGVDYPFDLKPGENFYFIIVLTDEGEQYVYVGKSPPIE